MDSFPFHAPAACLPHWSQWMSRREGRAWHVLSGRGTCVWRSQALVSAGRAARRDRAAGRRQACRGPCCRQAIAKPGSAAAGIATGGRAARRACTQPVSRTSSRAEHASHPTLRAICCQEDGNDAPGPRGRQSRGRRSHPRPGGACYSQRVHAHELSRERINGRLAWWVSHALTNR